MLRAALATALAACANGPPDHGTVCSELGGSRPTQCGAELELTPVNRYAGAVTAVADREDAVALIDGNCTGTLIAAAAGPVVLTAGHCGAVGARTLIAFNVEADRDGDALVTMGSVFESALDPDYALIQLDQLPAIAPTPLATRTTDVVAIIQHPRGGPKVVAEGDLLGTCGPQLAYGADTLVGSSGAGVLAATGFVIAVHSDGDCSADGGANRGWTAANIVEVSAYLAPADLGDR